MILGKEMKTDPKDQRLFESVKDMQENLQNIFDEIENLLKHQVLGKI